MYIKRPLSYVALIFSILIFLFISIFPIKTNFDVDAADGLKATVVGKVSFKDSKNGYTRLYLDDVVIWFDGLYDSDASTFDDRDVKYKSTGIICEISEEEYEADYIKIGQKIKITGEFNCYDTASNEGQFDLKKHYSIRGYEGKIRKGEIEAKSEKYSHIKESLFQIKIVAEGIFSEYMTEEDSGIMCALILGDKTDLDDDIKEVYQNAGISHILSLSGLHIASVGLCLLSLLKRSGMPSLVSNVISSAVMILYAIMTGMSTSTKRALIMFLLAIVADIMKKTYDILSAAAFAYICTLISNPYYLLDSGFLLSFGAIIGISVFYPAVRIILFPLKRKIKDGSIKTVLKNWSLGLVESFLVTFSITLTTLPVVASFYYKISRYSFICNLIVIPLVGVVLATGIVAAGVGMISRLQILKAIWIAGPAGALCCSYSLKIASAILRFYEYIATRFSKLPYNSFVTGRPKLSGIIFYCIFMIFILIMANMVEKITHTYRIIDRKSLDNAIDYMRNHGKKHYKITPMLKKIIHDIRNGENIRYLQRYSDEFDSEKKKLLIMIRCVFIIMMTLSLWILTNKTLEQLEIRNLYIGQGDCSVIFGRNTPVIIIDGGSSDVKQAGKYRLEPVLLSNGVNKVDYIFLSHLDNDHTSAVLELLDDSECGVSVENVVITKALLVTEDEETKKKLLELKTSVINSGSRLYSISAGDVIKDGDLRIECIWPSENNELNIDGNSSSMVLSIENTNVDFKALFTGDIDNVAEQEIANLSNNPMTNSIGHQGKIMYQEFDLRKFDYLKVAHHGSNGSSSEELLNSISPMISVISCGLNNRYNHPGQDALDRLSQVKGNHIFRTDLQGEIITRVDRKGKVRVSTYFTRK